MKLLFFGPLGDLAQTQFENYVPSQTVLSIADLITDLGQHNAALAKALRLETVRVAVNAEIVKRDAPITENDEIAFLPPMSGG